MLSLAAVLSVVLAVWIAVVQPFAGRRRYRRLIEHLHRDPSVRLHHYRRGIALEWVGAAFVGLLALLAHTRLRSLWPPGDHTEVAGQIPVVVAALVAITAVYRFGGQAARRALAVQLRPVAALLPRTPTERRVFALLAVTAGICEELLYRGFGLAALRWAAPDTSTPTLIGVTAVAFGVGHLYQGASGVALTGLVGASFAWFAISTGSLLPVMLLHALLDLRILALPIDAVPFPTPEPTGSLDGQ
ncbi:MAG TPA: CPBP family glutamic-type intramembrane protease [Acidimicrobiia bacterium]|nr:CPBP family glutamic-type intramembrane protease [Acidimicrobiia bacterium]